MGSLILNDGKREVIFINENSIYDISFAIYKLLALASKKGYCPIVLCHILINQFTE